MYSKMTIKNLFSKRKPNHLIVYVLYNKKEKFLYKILSKLTYSIGPFSSIDDCIEGVNKFIKKYPDKLKQINITSYGTGKFLVQTTDNKLKVLELVNSLRPLINNDTRLMFTTCFSGIASRKVVEMSEELNGIEVSAMNGTYSLNGDMTICKCKEKGYSKSVVEKLPQSKNGIRYDENQIVDVVRRDEGEEINWKTSGMAYEYNKIMIENGICLIGKQPYTLLKSIRNYLFNIQS
jgi:hypothetical protein